MTYLTFAGDHDIAAPTADASFRNIQVYEDDQVTQIPMWGFALDADCDLTTDGLEVATSPGPMIRGEGTTLRVFLRNDLPEPVSLVIPGQEMPWVNAPTPVWDDGTSGPRTDLTQRVRSFTAEAAPGGGTQTYIWSGFRETPLTYGSFIYQSGTDPAKQVQMGLYGPLAAVNGAGNYPGIGFDQEAVLFYSEIDPALHSPPAAANPRNYQPQYFLVNGEPFDPSDPASQHITGLLRNKNILVRFFNAGLRTHVPTILDEELTLRAEDGKIYPDPRVQYSVPLPAGKTADAIFRSATAETFTLHDRRLALSTGPSDPGGMLSYLVLQDKVQIVRTRYNATNGLQVWANSAGAPAETLHVVECANAVMPTFGANADYRLFCAAAVNPGTATVNSDGGSTDTRPVPFTAPPIGVDDTFDNAAAGNNVLTNDRKGGYFAAADAISAVLVNQPAHGTVVLNADGTFTYTPTVAGACIDTFTYRPVANGTVQGSAATVTIRF